MDDAGRILVIDDDAVVVQMTLRLLQQAGYEAASAATGAEGLRLAHEWRPDLVLLDRVLPDVDGAEVCRRIKADPDLVRVLVVHVSSMKISSDEQADGLEGGSDGYMVRPIPNREFLARVQAMMRIKRAEDERERLVGELQAALAQVKTLSGLLPICASCKKIRDDSGYWQRLEAYIQEHSDATFTHGICPECARKLFPDIDL